MKGDLVKGYFTPAELAEMKQEALMARYKVGRQTVRDARSVVLHDVGVLKLRQSPTRNK